MQSDSDEVTQKTSLNQITHFNLSDSKHGLHRPGEQPTHQPSAGEGRAKSRRSGSNTSSSVSSRGSDDSLERSLRGLRKGSPVDRIAEHENASSYLPKKRGQGPAFAVIQRGRNVTTGQVVLADFPNGTACTISHECRTVANFSQRS